MRNPASELSKDLRSRHVSMISIGGIIGAGLFVGSSSAIASVGPAILLSYVIAGSVVFVVMRMLTEMVSAHPGLGSFTEYVRLGLGNWSGFVSGWLYWYFWVVVVAIEAIAGATLLNQWIDVPVWLIGLVLMTVLTGVNLMSSRSYGEFEFWFASIKVAAIVAFILIAGAHAFGFSSPEPTLHNLVSHGGLAPFGVLSILAGMATVIFSLCGAEIATVAAAESSEPDRAMSRLTGAIIVRILIFYVLSIFMVMAVVPWNEVLPGQSPFGLALSRTHIPAAALVMDAVVLTAVLSCLNSGVYVTSRVLFTLARHGEAPQALVRLNRRKVPTRAIWAGSLFGFGAVIVSVVSPERVFTFLVNASGALMLIVYFFVCVAQIRWRKSQRSADPPIKVWLFPCLSYVAAAAILGVLLAMVVSPELSSQLQASLVCLVVVLAAYWITQRREEKGRYDVSTEASGKAIAEGGSDWSSLGRPTPRHVVVPNKK